MQLIVFNSCESERGAVLDGYGLNVVFREFPELVGSLR